MKVQRVQSLPSLLRAKDDIELKYQPDEQFCYIACITYIRLKVLATVRWYVLKMPAPDD